DHEVFRDGLRAVLQSHSDCEVVGEAADARTGYAVVESTRPDVVLLDISLPGVDGLHAARELHHRVPESRVLILSAFAHADQVTQALAAGAHGYALKDQSADEIVRAIRLVGGGQRYLPAKLEHLGREGALASGEGDAPLEHLSPREREVF